MRKSIWTRSSPKWQSSYHYGKICPFDLSGLSKPSQTLLCDLGSLNPLNMTSCTAQNGGKMASSRSHSSRSATTTLAFCSSVSNRLEHPISPINPARSESVLTKMITLPDLCWKEAERNPTKSPNRLIQYVALPLTCSSSSLSLPRSMTTRRGWRGETEKHHPKITA